MILADLNPGDSRRDEVIAYVTAPGPNSARDAKACGVDPAFNLPKPQPPSRPGEWLEHSPLLTILLALLAAGWLFFFAAILPTMGVIGFTIVIASTRFPSGWVLCSSYR